MRICMESFRPSNSGGYGGRSGGGRSFGGRSGGFRGRDSARGPPQMHDVTCTKCGKACQVPFRPTGSKPVLCSECFSAEGGGSRDRARSGGNGASQEQMDKMNAKLDKIIKILSELELDVEEEGSEDESEEDLVENSEDKKE